MRLTTIDSLPGSNIVNQYGIVQGGVLCTTKKSSKLWPLFKKMFGGELNQYTSLLQKHRSQALEKMIQEAKLKGANAITDIRFSTSKKSDFHIEICCHGRAVQMDSPILAEKMDYKLYGAGLVISAPWSRRFWAGLWRWFGGRKALYEMLVAQGQQEAMSRIQLKIARWGAQEFVNMQIEAAPVVDANNSCIEIFAYGTALKPAIADKAG